MKILILGAYGMLGHQLFLKLSKKYDTYASCRSFKKEWSHIIPRNKVVTNVIAESESSIIDLLTNIKPDVVINCIGIIKQLDSAKDPIPSLSINSLFPHKLSKLCQLSASRLIHFSTDCVFSGIKGDYIESDDSDAKDLYGKSKHLGELNDSHCFTVRSSIIGRELDTKNGLLEWCLNQKGKTIQGFDKAIYSGFTTQAMGTIVQNIIENFPGLSGVYHISSAPISKYRLLSKVNEIFNLKIEIQKNIDFICDRSLNSKRFLKETSFVSPSWDEMIQDLYKERELYESI